MKDQIDTLSKSQMKNILKYMLHNEFGFEYSFKIVVDDKREYPD